MVPLVYDMFFDQVSMCLSNGDLSSMRLMSMSSRFMKMPVSSISGKSFLYFSKKTFGSNGFTSQSKNFLMFTSNIALTDSSSALRNPSLSDLNILTKKFIKSVSVSPRIFNRFIEKLIELFAFPFSSNGFVFVVTG